MLDSKNITALVVNYNAGFWLVKSVTSLIESNVPLCIYVVDNHSTDDSIETLRNGVDSSSIKIIENTENRGFAAANNQVLNTVASDYFVLVNPDCMVEKDTVAKIIDVMERDTQIGLASCVIRNSNGEVQKTCRRDFPTPWSGLVRVLGLSRFFPRFRAFADFDLGRPSEKDSVEFVEAISGAFMVVKGETVKKVGLLDERYFMHCEDLDWCMRCWRSGYKVAFIPGAEVTHAKGISGNSNRMKVNWHLHKGMIHFYKKFYKEKYPLPIMWLVYSGIGVRFLAKGALLFFISLLPSYASKP